MRARSLVQRRMTFVACVAACATQAVARHADAESLRVVVRVSPADEALLGRVRGQVADLEVDLLVEGGVAEASLGEQLRRAREIADARAARVVVWFVVAEDDGREALLLHVAEPSTGRVLVRRVEARGSPTGRVGRGVREDTATLESAGLIVRAVLRALAAGGSLGVERAAARPVVASARPAPAGRAPAIPPVSAGAGARRVQPRWYAAVGWDAAFDGVGGVGHHAPALRLGLRVARFEVSAAAASGLPITIADARASVQLARSALAVHGGFAAFEAPDWSLLVGIRAGTAVYFRATTALVPSLEPTAPRALVSVLFGPDARLAWHPGWTGRHLGLVLTAAIDVVPGAPTLVVQTSQGFEPFASAWIAQPRAGLSLEVTTP